jgi:hypothetical protein
MMPAPDVALLARHLRAADVYLEYGAGGSTVLAAGLCPTVVSAESDRAFLHAVTRKVREVHPACRFYPVHCDIGPTGPWGRPRPARPLADAWRRYPDAPWEVLHQLHLEPTLVLIDGRFRVACALRVLLEWRARPGALMLFDDFTTRRYYRVVLEFAGEVERGRRLVVLRPKAVLDEPRGRALLEQYRRDWR